MCETTWPGWGLRLRRYGGQGKKTRKVVPNMTQQKREKERKKQEKAQRKRETKIERKLDKDGEEIEEELELIEGPVYFKDFDMATIKI